MKIAVYIESLRTFTSGTPHRGMLKELLRIREKDSFILVLRGGTIPPHLSEFFQSIHNFKNWTLYFENRSEKFNNLLAFFRFKNHCQLEISADLYLNLDSHFLGTKNRPQIITVHDLSSVKSGRYSSLGRIQRFARKFTITNGIKNADCITTISDFTREDILDRFSDVSEITTIHNGIDPSWFTNENQSHFDETENYWIWYGGFTKRKNLIRLLDAYSLLLKENSLVNEKLPALLFVGNPNKYMKDLQSFISSDKVLEKKVSFRKSTSLDELICLVSGSRGLVFPSLYEGFGLPVIEAFTQGVPVYTSKVSSLPEIAGGNAVMVDPFDTSDMKKGLQEFYFNGNICDKTKLKEWASTFTYQKCALGYSKVIDQVISTNG